MKQCRWASYNFAVDSPFANDYYNTTENIMTDFLFDHLLDKLAVPLYDFFSIMEEERDTIWSLE